MVEHLRWGGGVITPLILFSSKEKCTRKTKINTMHQGLGGWGTWTLVTRPLKKYIFFVFVFPKGDLT